MVSIGRKLVRPIKLRIPGTDVLDSKTVGAKLHASKGEQPRSPIKVPKFTLSALEGGEVSQTVRMLA